MDLTLLIATYNRAQLLQKLFESLSVATWPKTLDWEILVVDNNSSDDTQSVVESLTHSSLPALRYCFESRQGKSFALNTGLEEARGEFIAFLDDDVLVFPDYLLGLATFIRSDSYNVFGGKILPLWPYDPPAWITKGKPFLNLFTRGGIVAHDYGEVAKEYGPGMRLPVGANWGCRRRLFQEYGAFKTYLGPQGKNPGGSEDTDIVPALPRRRGDTFVCSSDRHLPSCRARPDDSFLFSASTLYGRTPTSARFNSAKEAISDSRRNPAFPVSSRRSGNLELDDLSRSRTSK